MTRKKLVNTIFFAILVIMALYTLFPIVLVTWNSFKGNAYISTSPFTLPNTENSVGLSNYIAGIEKTNFLNAFGYSLFITVFSVIAIVLFCSMCGWYLVRVKTKLTKAIYYSLVLGMVIPFQMVMYTMTKVSNMLKLDNPVGIILIYLGFGAGMATFMFTGYIQSVPFELEEAALVDGCSPFQIFFKVIFPILKPILITVAILDAMWIWNDFLLPYLIIGSKFRTIPVAIQYLKTGFGSIDYGQLMALILINLVPIVAFYFACQKYIVEGIIMGAVKG